MLEEPVKTRIIYTKIWQDDFFVKLSRQSKLLFLYLITNSRIGMTGYFEVSDRVIKFDTGLSDKELENSKKELVDKIRFYKGWVFILNAERYNTFRGDKNEKAVEAEIKEIPRNVKDALNDEKVYRVSEKVDRVSEVSDTSITIINNHNHNHNKYRDIENIKENEIKQVAEKYKVSTKYVERVLDRLANDIEIKGKDKYANKLAALRNWVSNQIEWDEKDGKKIILKDLEPHQIEDLRKNPDKLSVYKKAGYDVSRLRK